MDLAIATFLRKLISKALFSSFNHTGLSLVIHASHFAGCKTTQALACTVLWLVPFLPYYITDLFDLLLPL
jgi:hypothetical protein